jgi:hypothetical protein
MPSYEEVTTHAGSVWAITGLTGQEFEALLSSFESAVVAITVSLVWRRVPSIAEV